MQNTIRYKIKLKPTSPLHIGYKENLYNVSEYIIHSDTLMSGIINCYSLLYGKEETDKLCDAFLEGEIPFKVSSCMPYYNNEYFVFKPLSIDLGYVLSNDEYKKIKKVKYIPLDMVLNIDKNKSYSFNGEFLTSNNKQDFKPLKKEVARIDIDRVTSRTNIYYFSKHHFKNDFGFWLFLDVIEDYRDRILSAIKLLCDEGIGGDRTVGNGFFEFAGFEIDKSDIKKDAKRYFSISLVSPKDEDEINKLIAYEITERGGYLFSHFSNTNQKRKKTYTLIEGSVFGGIVYGKVYDVTPKGFSNHKVLRNSLAYLLPLAIEE